MEKQRDDGGAVLKGPIIVYDDRYHILLYEYFFI